MDKKIPDCPELLTIFLMLSNNSFFTNNLLIFNKQKGSHLFSFYSIDNSMLFLRRTISALNSFQKESLIFPA